MMTAIIYLHEDINECALTTSCCNQICENKDGGYDCLCEPGFSMANDSCTCQGKQKC